MAVQIEGIKTLTTIFKYSFEAQ